MKSTLPSGNTFFVNKNLGETPLQCLERTRVEQKLGPAPLTYAGRLDPMAEGLLVVLAGEECKRKDHYLGLDKTYDTEFLVGVETDTHDVLGVVRSGASIVAPLVSPDQFRNTAETFLGKRTQKYPAYSSKPHNGTPLFALARAGELPAEDEMPSREVEIYSIEVTGERTASVADLEKQIIERISRVRGDFRQEEIIARWREFFREKAPLSGAGSFQLFSLRVHCSSGTYIRSLAHEVGKRLGIGAIAFSIKRTQVGDFTTASLHATSLPSKNP